MTTWSDGRQQSSTARGYGYAWQRAREGYLREHPLCDMHMQRGQVMRATVVDHKVPHRGDKALFWDKKNWQPLCKPCHDSFKQRAEKSGRASAACGVDGLPHDPRHPWFKPATVPDLPHYINP